MAPKSLDDEACWERLRSEELGRLAVAVAGRPDIFPINYTVSDGAIYLRSAEGSKLVSVVINEVGCVRDRWLCPSGQPRVERRCTWQGGTLGESGNRGYVAGLPLFPPWNTSPKNRFIKIDVLELSGRSFCCRGAPPARQRVTRRTWLALFRNDSFLAGKCRIRSFSRGGRCCSYRLQQLISRVHRQAPLLQLQRPPQRFRGLTVRQ